MDSTNTFSGQLSLQSLCVSSLPDTSLVSLYSLAAKVFPITDDELDAVNHTKIDTSFENTSETDHSITQVFLLMYT